MSISIFHLPKYKSLDYTSVEFYRKGKTSSCKDRELEEFEPIWVKIACGSFPGGQCNFNRRILNDEYSMYPIVFIVSDVWAGKDNKKPHGTTCVHVVQKQDQNTANCRSYENRFIDRKLGVIVLEKTIFHDTNKEPAYRHWFYEKDERQELPEEILKETFSKSGKGIFLSIEKWTNHPDALTPADLNEWDNKYVTDIGYLTGDKIKKFVRDNTLSDSPSVSCKLIEWQDSWNFVVCDYYGQKMFRVEKKQVEDFFAINNLFV